MKCSRIPCQDEGIYTPVLVLSRDLDVMQQQINNRNKSIPILIHKICLCETHKNDFHLNDIYFDEIWKIIVDIFVKNGVEPPMKDITKIDFIEKK